MAPNNGAALVSRTSSLRKQHDALVALAGEIGDACAALGHGDDAAHLHGLLGQFDTILTAHLASEDRLLYPEMLAAADRKTAALASRFCEEMGGLVADYARFAAHWNSAEALRANPDGFRREWTELNGALNFRIQRENAELYPLADALGDESGHAAD